MKIYDLFIKNRFSKFWAVSSIFDLFSSQKSFSQTTILPIEKSKKTFLFGQKFFYVHFLLRSYVHFWNPYEKKDFLIPHLT